MAIVGLNSASLNSETALLHSTAHKPSGFGPHLPNNFGWKELLQRSLQQTLPLPTVQDPANRSTVWQWLDGLRKWSILLAGTLIPRPSGMLFDLCGRDQLMSMPRKIVNGLGHGATWCGGTGPTPTRAQLRGKFVELSSSWPLRVVG